MQPVANQLFVELQAPADLNGGVTASYFSMKNIGRVSIYVHLGAVSSLADDMTVTLYEATAVAGTGATALDIPRAYTYDAATDVYTAATVATDGTIVANANEVLVLDIDESDLTQGYDCLGITIADPGQADSYGAVYAIGQNLKALESALTD